MNSILNNFKITINEKLFLKDPETSELGKKILQNSIIIINDIGFDAFTFKKLGDKIGSNESSIYRYFESKHKLLVYLSTWYWSWIEYQLVFATTNVSDPIKKLENAINVITQSIQDDRNTSHIDESILNRIVISEFNKTLLTKVVDEENKEGFFLVYKRVIYRLIEIIKEVNPSYEYSKSLASLVVDGALHQHYLKFHFKTITDCTESNPPTSFFKNLVLKQLI
jgi:AcrR family transcriptional regulator